MAELYFKLLNVALSQYNVELLVKIWSDSTMLAATGLVLRSAINQALPQLAQHYRISHDEYNTFHELVAKYDLQVFKHRCTGDLLDCVETFARTGDLRNLKFALAKGTRKHHRRLEDLALEAAALTGQRHVIDYLLRVDKTLDSWKWYTIAAAEGGYQDLIEFFLARITGENRESQRAEILGRALEGAARGGHRELIDWLMAQGAGEYERAWYLGLVGALEGGHADLAQFFLQLGHVDVITENGWGSLFARAARGGHVAMLQLVLETNPGYQGWNWNDTLIVAARHGHLAAVKYLIQHGAHDLNKALIAATDEEHRAVIDYLIAQGADNWGVALYYAVKGRHAELVRFFVSKGVTKEQLSDALNPATFNKDRSMLRFLLEQGADIQEALEGTFYNKRRGLAHWLVNLGAIPDEKITAWLEQKTT